MLMLSECIHCLTDARFSCKNGSVDIWQEAAFIVNKYCLFLKWQSLDGCWWLSCFGGTESC